MRHEGKRQFCLQCGAEHGTIIAAIATITSLLAGDHANEAMVSQIQASDQWSYYQAKGVKAGVLGTKLALLEALQGRPVRRTRGKDCRVCH